MEPITVIVGQSARKVVVVREQEIGTLLGGRIKLRRVELVTVGDVVLTQADKVLHFRLTDMEETTVYILHSPFSLPEEPLKQYNCVQE